MIDKKKISSMVIIINSSNRSNVKTHELFPDTIDWYVAIPHDQVKQYKKIKKINKRLYAIPKEVPQYLPSQRQHIMEHFGQKYKYVFLMDDDLVFFKKNKKGKLKKCTKKDVSKMITSVRKHLDEIPMVGISTRLGNNRVSEDYVDIGRVTRCYALNSEVFKKVGATFAPFEPFVAEDFHMALCFLNKGYKNRIIFKYAQEDIGSNAKGGCSSYRTEEVQKKTSFWMTTHHPEVTIKAKKSNNWDGFGKYRVDMIVQWKKAYKTKEKPNTTWLKKK